MMGVVVMCSFVRVDLLTLLLARAMLPSASCVSMRVCLCVLLLIFFFSCAYTYACLVYVAVVCLLREQASVPYLEMLETWIYDGNLDDQYGETSSRPGQVDHEIDRDLHHLHLTYRCEVLCRICVRHMVHIQPRTKCPRSCRLYGSHTAI